MPIIKSTSKAFPKSKKVLGDIPFVLRVEFSELESTGAVITGKPIACFKCNAFLQEAELIKDDPKIGKHFVCKFCGTLNVIEGEIILADADSDVVLHVPETTDESTGVAVIGGNALLALIDVSGSMSGANLAAVKRSLIGTVESLAENSPDTLFGLIAFSSQVYAINMITGNYVDLSEDVFQSREKIETTTKQLLDDIGLVPIGPNRSKIKDTIQGFAAGGGTALGPAVVMALTIAKLKSVERVVLLTDGLANIGIGSLEGFQVPPARQFYQELGEMFKGNSTIFDVVGIASGSGMELRTLGLMPEATGGQMYYVTPNELDESLSEIAGAQLLGRDVTVRLITPPGIRVVDASGVSASVVSQLQTSMKGQLGTIRRDQEIHLEVEPETEIDSSEVPIQVQIEYTDFEGNRRLRVVTEKMKVAQAEDEIMESLDPTVCTTFVTQKAGEDAFSGREEKGMSRMKALKESFKRRAKSAPSPVRKELDRAQMAIDDEIQLMETASQQMKAAGSSSGAADMFFTEQIRRMRKTSKQMFDDEDDE